MIRPVARALIAAGALVLAPLPGAAEAPSPLGRLLEAPRASSWLVAQSATCELDGRKVPRGIVICSAGREMRCNARGQWEATGKPC